MTWVRRVAMLLGLGEAVPPTKNREISGESLTLDQLPLTAVDAVTFYKRDQLTTDLICCDIAFDDLSLTIHEERQDWERTIAHLSRLPGFRSDWCAFVSQPPFATSEFVAFRRR